MTHNLLITHNEKKAIDFSAGRYGWSDILRCNLVEEGEGFKAELGEAEVSDLVKAIQDEGLPLLDPRSNLSERLWDIYYQIV